MIKRVCFSFLFILLTGLILIHPKVALAQSACTNLSGCILRRSTDLNFPNLGCSGTRDTYDCSGTTCYQDSATCNTNQAVCNNPPSTGDNYTCVKFCTDLKNTPGNCCPDGTPTSQCGDPPAEHCADYYNTCVNSYCHAAGSGQPDPSGTGNYTCPSPQQCVSPSDPKAHQCVTPAACTYPDPSTVSCGQPVNATNGPNCSSPQTITGTGGCTTGGICSNGVCTGYSITGNLIQCEIGAGGTYTTSPLNQQVTVNLSGQASQTKTTGYNFGNLSAGTYTLSAGVPNNTWQGPYDRCGGTVISSINLTVGPSQVQHLYYEQTSCSITWQDCTSNTQSCLNTSCTQTGTDCNGLTYTRSVTKTGVTCPSGTTCSSSGICQSPTTTAPPPPPGQCALTLNSFTQTSASITASASGFTDPATTRFDWWVDSPTNYTGANTIADQPSFFSGFSAGTSHTVYSQAWSTGSPSTTSVCQITFTTLSAGAKYKCSSGSCIRDDVAGTYTDSTCNNSCAVTNCDCTAPPPTDCGQTTSGVCAGTNIACAKSGPACVNEARIVFNFYNEDGVTPYSGAAFIKLLEDDKYGNDHNDLFYGPNGTYAHNANQGVKASEITSWHPYRDPGYQINADGTLSGCPPENLDSCCTGPIETCSEVAGYSCTTASGYTCTPSCQYSCRSGAYCCGDCKVNQPNDTYLNAGSTPNEPSVWPRCFSPASGRHVDITAANTRFEYSTGYFDLGLPTQQAPRDQLRAYSIGAPAGYQLKVNLLCNGTYDGGCNSGVLQGLKNQGLTVKNFTAAVAGLTNYWASPYEKVDGNTSILAYDVSVLVPKFKLSGRVFEDINYDQINTGEPPLANATVTLTSAKGQSFFSAPTDATGAYAFLNLPSANYSLTFTPPQGYTSTMTLPISIPLTADTVRDLGAARSYAISGNVRVDTNHNSVCESSEPGAFTASVNLLGGPSSKPSVNPSGTGAYSFRGLRAGTYSVSVSVGADQQVSPAALSVVVGPDATEKNFCTSTFAPWLQTTGGDIHSNTNISLPRGPTGP